MSGLEALSMACSVMQVISFTKEVLTLCKDVYDGRPTTDSQMEENTASIQSLLIEMNRHSGSIKQQTKEEKELHAIAQKCNKAAQELQKEIQEITQHHEPGDWVKAMIAVYTAKSRKRKVAELYDRFCKYQKTLEAHILFRLCSKADAVEIQQREGFANLSDTMKHFISQLAAGHTEIANLIARDGNQTRQQIRKSEARVKQSIIDIHSAVEYEAMKSSLLRSLKYESMNSRRTELKPAHEATYVSIFESLDQDENSTSSSAAAWRNFVQWLQSDKRVFWIQGKPGSGKSTLMKFLLQHKNTQRGVDKWNTNTLIISHFFWKPGNILQKNLKGLLCSLTHQLLSSEHNLVDHVLSQFLFAEHKETIGDWEILELKTIFHSMLIQCKRSIFFLIDGLDEATETETEEIFQFLDSLIDLPNAKLCISSRGEDIFLRKFSVYDGFKLHELTRDDMLQLASIGIPIPDERYQSGFLKDLRNMLVEKAEGIYLWLVIALESVKRGLRNNDAQHEIRLRLSKLPSKLEELFADMWSRLGEDKDIYQKEAARYFSLLILNQSFLDKYSQCYDSDIDWRLSSFQLTLATNDKMKANILNKSYQLPVSELNKNCANTTKGISIKTAGLLVTKNTNQLGFDPVLEYNMKMKSILEPEQLIQYLENKIDFIHRTLFDFLKDTEVGKSILAQSQTHRLDVDLASIILCQLRSLQYHQELQSARRILSQGFNGPLHYFCWCLGEIFGQNSASETNTNIALLHMFEGLFEAGLLPWDIRPKWYPLPCLEALLLGNSAFNEFIQSRVDDKGTSYATRFLRDFMFGKALRYGREWSLSDREERLHGTFLSNKAT
ncbi:uncharacterized protein TRIVIDRAFT_202804 [Trichoderma virens Gv29-8]|uniref:Uncharacterized protein n=1 Tax=Hypocrea virens (strain Gv29-8 / FGSC 10586) TaxID=413071 RepID=G9MYE5_HYPVG|nr:uncharacterized protein TRIVIDRAFT_202804 [Trichoderma virens Gv29-8]EHK20567.1 hypothetical protein TRIVIDRAFT_202804 [Trichoderma virens Gv29-8]